MLRIIFEDLGVLRSLQHFGQGNRLDVHFDPSVDRNPDGPDRSLCLDDRQSLIFVHGLRPTGGQPTGAAPY
jgi:hypothetical protein